MFELHRFSKRFLSRRIKPGLQWLIGAAILIGCEFAYTEQPQALSNWDFLYNVTCGAIRKLADSLDWQQGARYALINHPQDRDQAWFVENCIIQSVNEFGISNIYQDSCSVAIEDSEMTCALFYKIIELDLSYQPISKWSFRSEKKLHRTANASFQVRLTNCRNGKILWSGIVENQARDELPVKNAQQFRTTALPITVPEIPSQSVLKKFLEPALVLMATGVIIYSFYALRST
ncbi:hypothetical protein JXJ21_11790 [candidate division KSB1 bacterium]|nr:hypothetical protein [candidate division KSB1 bacterium]